MYQYYSPSFIREKPSSASTLYARPTMSTASSSAGSTGSGVAQRSSTWQDRLQAHCSQRHLSSPEYKVFSDRRGKRTAWSCHITVSGLTIPARYWYDGQYVNTAKEDAAEAALQKLLGRGNGVMGSVGQGRVVGW
ncbi:hypothetical protein HO133_010132 [Letharia lupina]|uniref:DRBM domain-containing protein n=1 Tax=Letharia lupina TaxID=560253 RepID=A0A8H6CJZ8_9LECA|nr:uncharacterized protein HO133_010132 [Letharia lupina]KAF6224938.1 hypothetical protein HO133_010132 [Letharia lupina]